MFRVKVSFTIFIIHQIRIESSEAGFTNFFVAEYAMGIISFESTNTVLHNCSLLSELQKLMSCQKIVSKCHHESKVSKPLLNGPRGPILI